MVLLGPPGSGRSVQAEKLAQAYGLVNVCPDDLLKVEAEKNPGIKLKIKESIDAGEAVPDEIMLRLVDARLRQSDCKVNGWVLDGFPQTESQVNLLRSMRIKPSLVVLLEQGLEECVRRLGNKRLDPRTGKCYNTEVYMPADNATVGALVTRAEDSEANVKKRFQAWASDLSMLEEAYKDCLCSEAADKSIDAVAEAICFAVDNQKDC